MDNRTIFIALAGLAVGTGAAMLLTPRRTRNTIASQARYALGYAKDHAEDYMPSSSRSPRRKNARSATKRKMVRKGRKMAHAA